MPRAFLITNRRYNSAVEYDSRDSSPDRKTDPLKAPTRSQTPIDVAPSKTSLYQAFYSGFHSLSSLEQLAEISLATAHRWHLSPPSSPETGPALHPLAAAAAGDVPLCLAHPSSQRALSNLQDERSSPSSCSDDGTRLSSGSGSSTAGERRFHHHPYHRHFPYHRGSGSGSGGGPPDDLDDGEEDMADDSLSETGDELLADGSWGPEEDLLGAGGEANNVCPECGKRYSTSSNLARHRQTHRSMSDKKARKCPHCDKVYVSMPAYSMHVRTHDPVGCQCPFCGKCFSRPWLLQGHIRTHTGEKPFKCHVCGKAFADKSNLRAHIQTHSDTKPYVCQRCGKAFALKSYLYKHEESSCMRSHGGSGGRAAPDAKEGAPLKAA